MNPDVHLSDEELYEALDGPEGFAAEEHLTQCARCRLEVDCLRTSLSGLRMSAATLAEAEFRPVLKLSPAGMWGKMQAWPLSVAAAAVILAASFSLVHWPVSPGSVDQATAQTVAGSPAADTDDALLDGIDRDLSTSVAPSLAPLDVSATEAAENAAKRN